MYDHQTTHPTPSASPFVRASSIEPAAVDWLWQGFMPRGVLVILDGDPGLGKSTLVADLVAHMTTCRPLPEMQRAAGPMTAIIANAEDDPAVVTIPRLIAAGADLDRVNVMSLDAEVMLDHDGMIKLEDAVAEVGASLVVIDPFFAFTPADVDAHRDTDVRRVLRRLSRIAGTTGATVVLVRHPNKSVGASALHRGGGSIGIIGAARIALVLARVPDGAEAARALAVTKSNYGQIPRSLTFEITPDPTGMPKLLWTGTTPLSADDLMRPPATMSSPKLESAEEFIRATLANGKVASSVVYAAAREAGHADATVRRAIRALGVTTTREGYGDDGRHYLELPGTAPPA